MTQIQKNNVRIIDIANKLGLKESSYGRYHCPNKKGHQNGDKTASLFLSDSIGFNCFGCGIHGNDIELIKIVRKCTTEEAFEWKKNNFNEGNVNGHAIPEGSKKHLRLISGVSKQRFIFKKAKEIIITEPTEEDLVKIESILKKRWSLQTINFLGVKICKNPYSLVYDFGSVQYEFNPNQIKTKYLFLEGRSDLVSAVEIGLQNVFGLISRYNKSIPIIIPLVEQNAEFYFILDKDDEPENVLRIINEKKPNIRDIKIKFIKPPELNKDLSDWVFNDGINTEQILQCFENEDFMDLQPVQNINELIDSEDPPKFTDVGNSIRFFKKWEDEVRFNHSSGKWMIWNSKVWQTDLTNQIIEFAKETVKEINNEECEICEDEKEKDKIMKWVKSSESKYRISSMIKLSESIEKLAVTQNSFDNNIYLLNLENGVYDLKSNTFKLHDPNELLSKIIHIDYDKNSKCKEWDNFLNTIFKSDAELIKFVQRAVGYSLCGEISEEVFFFCYGTGANGKSVFFKVISMVAGDYFLKAPSEMVIQKNNDSIPNDIARLNGARIVVASELPEQKSFNESKLKDLSGSDMLTGRFLFCEYSDFTPTHTLWIYGNHKPKVKGTDFGIWRRLKMIPFQVKITDQERIPSNVLDDMFRKELPGILNWVLQGWKDYQDQGLNPPAKVLIETEQYKKEEDVVHDFLNERCTTDSKARIQSKILYNDYLLWCKNNNDVPIGNRTFYKQIEEKGFASNIMQKSRMKEFIGIRIKEDNELFEDD